MIGAAAIKIGEGVATVVTVNSTAGQYEMPLLRCSYELNMKLHRKLY